MYGMVRDSIRDCIRGITGRNGAGQDGMGVLPGLLRASWWSHSRLARGRYGPYRYMEQYGMARCVVPLGTAQLFGLVRVY